MSIAGLARSTFYYHQARLGRVDKHEDLAQAIRGVFEHAKGRYGHRRIRLVLMKDGWRVSNKLVAKLMKREGLTCITRPKRRYNSYRGTVSNIADNVLKRDFVAHEPNRKWVSDITEFRLAGRKVYLSPIIDLYDHQVIAHRVGLAPTTSLSAASLKDAIAKQHPQHGLIVHTDQGFHYQHSSWKNQLAKIGAIQSMSRKGNCYDNSLAENFFSHLKTEFYYPSIFDTIEDFLSKLDQYITWYNNERIQERLKGLTPAQYRNQTLAA